MLRSPNKIDYPGDFPQGFEVFTSIQDPRDHSNTRHHFGGILFIAFAAVLSGVRTYKLMEGFAELRDDWLHKWLKAGLRALEGLPLRRRSSSPARPSLQKRFSHFETTARSTLRRTAPPAGISLGREAA